MNHPRINRLRAHHELRCDTELSQEEAKKFGAFNDIELFIVPQLAFAAREGLPRAHDGKGKELVRARFSLNFTSSMIRQLAAVVVVRTLVATFELVCDARLIQGVCH